MVGDVTFGAAIIAVMIRCLDPFQPHRPGPIVIVAPYASRIVQLRGCDVRIVRMTPSGGVTRFTRNLFMLESRQFLRDFAVALVASFSPGENRLA